MRANGQASLSPDAVAEATGSAFARPEPGAAAPASIAVHLAQGLIVLLLASSALGAEARLVVPYVRPGTWAAVEVEGLPAGEAIVVGGAGTTTWPHAGGRVIVPVLVPPRMGVGPTWEVTVAGEPFAFDVTVLSAGERLIIDASGGTVEVAALSPGARIARVDEEVPPAALAAANLVIREAGDASAEMVSRVPSAIVPVAYESVGNWRPSRSATERWSVVVVAGGIGLVCVVLLSQARRHRWTAWVALGLGLATAAGLAAWREVRSPIAVRQAALATGTGHVDEWFWLAAPDRREAVEATIAFAGLTLPAAYSPQHLERIAPTLVCDAKGNPLQLVVTIPAGSTAAVVRRREDAPINVPPWARALQRRLYPSARE